MKTRNIINVILTIALYGMGFFAAFLLIGSVGALECDNVSVRQFWIQILHSFVFFGITYIISIIRSYFRHFYMNDRRRYNNRPYNLYMNDEEYV